MLQALTQILLFQLLGEFAASVSGLPVPGPVIGMLLLFLTLVARDRVPDGLARVADGLLANLSLLFVPAGVGVMLHVRLIGEDWLPLGLALVASTLLTVMVTAWVMARLGRGDAADG